MLNKCFTNLYVVVQGALNPTSRMEEEHLISSDPVASLPPLRQLLVKLFLG
jgi:hypothetical protein